MLVALFHFISDQVPDEAGSVAAISIGALRDEHAELLDRTWILQPNDAGPHVVFLVNEFSFSVHFRYIQNGPVAASNAPF
jgi:hypothetical protein